MKRSWVLAQKSFCLNHSLLSYLQSNLQEIIMLVLQIEHLVPEFAGWKKVFDSDPLDRKQSGVRAHRICKTIDNPNYIIIELEFDNIQEAEKMHEKLKELWPRVEGNVMMNPQSRIIETIESIDYDR